MLYDIKRPLRIFEAFAGYGSQSLALERLHRNYPEFCYEIVGYSEIDSYAIKAYQALHGTDIPNFGDISQIDWSQVPDFDLFTMSSPCQDFSSAGLQRGGAEGSGTRSSLLWECRKAIIAKRPRYILFENVSALVSKKFLPYFFKWQAELASYGYTNFAQVLNARDYGVPQNRNRIFMVSIHDSEARYFFPKPFPLTKRLKDVLEDEVDESFYLSDERVQGLIKSTLKQQNKGNGFKFKPKTEDDVATTVQASGCNRKTGNFVVVNGAQDIANTVTAHYAKEAAADCTKKTWGGGSYIMQKQPPAPELRQIGNVLEWEGKAHRKNPNPYRVYDSGGIAPTIIAQGGGGMQPFIIEQADEQERDNND